MVRGVMLAVSFYLTGRTMDDPCPRVIEVAGRDWKWTPREDEGGFVLQELSVFPDGLHPDLCLVEADSGLIKSVRILTPNEVYTPIHPEVRLNLAQAAGKKLKMREEMYDDEFFVAYYGKSAFPSSVPNLKVSGGDRPKRVLH